MKQYALLLAGGHGKRLWPFSRNSIPKQFITLPHGKTLLEITLDRLQPLSHIHKIIVTTDQYSSRAQSIAQKYNTECLLEAQGRNTAPAIALSLREIRQRGDDDAIVMIMPTDHIIQKTTEFQRALTYAAHYTHINNALIVYGAPQTHVTTHFGFISYNTAPLYTQDNTFALHTLKKFHEKPLKAQAEKYYQDACMVWNMGIFIARASLLWELFLQHAPQIIAHLDNYAHMPAASFDRAVVEKSIQHIVVLPYDFGWNDMGSLETFIPAFYSNTNKHSEILGAHNNTIVAKKPVIIAGVSDLTILEMDDMIVITPRTITQSPELITQQIHRLGLEGFL